MQEYKRQIAYLYAYERGEQLRSTGFVKAEERGGHCRLALHLRGYCHPGEAAGNVYIYFYHQDRTIGIYLGALKNQNGALEWMRKIFWERESDLQTLTESGSSVLVEETMWRNGMIIRWIRSVLYYIRKEASGASAVHGLADVRRAE